MEKEQQSASTPDAVEQFAQSVGGKVIGTAQQAKPEGQADEWDKGESIKTGWVKLEVGESIKGTLLNKKIQKSTIQGFPDQWVYEIKVGDGIMMIGFSVDKTFINNKLKNLQIGQIVMIKRFEDVESKKYKGKFAKSFDARLFGMDESYLDQGMADDIPFE